MVKVDLETMTIEDLELSPRVYNALHRTFYEVDPGRVKLKRDASGKVLVKSVIKYTGKELVHKKKGVRRFGLTALWELQAALGKYGLDLAGE